MARKTRYNLKYQIMLHLGGHNRWNAFMDPVNGIFGVSRVPKRVDLLKKWPSESLQKGPKSPEMGQWCLPSEYWPVWPLCGVWNQIWCRTRLPEGLNVSYRGKSDSPEPPWTTQKTPRLPQNPSVTIPTTNRSPLVSPITHYYSQKAQITTETPKIPQNWDT